MPLDAVNFVPKGPVKSGDLMQFYNLFTGGMTDQPITFRNVVHIGGNQGITTVPLKLYGAAGQNTNLIDLYQDHSAVQPGFGFNAIGSHAWGPGGAAPQDTFMSRIGLQNGHATDTPGLYIVPRLEVDGPMQVDGDVVINGQLTASSTVVNPDMDVINVTRINLKPLVGGAFIKAYDTDSTYVHISKLTVTPGTTALAGVTVNGVSTLNGSTSVTGTLSVSSTATLTGQVNTGTHLVVGGRLVVGGYDVGWPANFAGNPIAQGRFYQRGNGSWYCYDVGDFTVSAGVVGDHVVQRNGSGHIFANYLNITADIQGVAPVYVLGQNGDGYTRWYPKAL